MDVVVTVPKNFHAENYFERDDWDDSLRGLRSWIQEGDAAGGKYATGIEWYFRLGGNQPDIVPGERVYIVSEGKLRGYAPLLRIEDDGRYKGRYSLVRGAGAVAVTISEPIQGFRGFRYRWWKYEDERPFPDWQTP